ncbi:hypothetical protein [Amycolatopsis sp. lyj-84]|uniref:hypothetical protein n=1 Tax=Amycolatopsis sp. lyj-84 TaxID=2789284 RepID=UPI00397DCAB7
MSPASDAAIVDLPCGYLDDPEGLEGLAALAARWIAATPGGSLREELGWHTRHRLEGHVSSFSYWTAMGDLGRLAGHYESRFGGPATRQLAGLREAQTRLLRSRSGNLYLRMLDTIETAASGKVHCGPLGDVESMARVSAEDVKEYLDRCRETGIDVHYASGASLGPVVHRSDAANPWRGGLVTAPVPEETSARVAVRLPLRADTLPDGALPLLVESLGTGAEGRLIRLLRGARGLAYGVAALSWDEGAGGASVGGYALVDPGRVAETATLLLDVVREALCQPVSAELADAAVRCRTLLLVQADEPFGAVADRRRRARGELPLGRLAEAVAERAEEGLDLGVPDSAPPAVAVTGEVRPDQLSRLESLT